MTAFFRLSQLNQIVLALFSASFSFAKTTTPANVLHLSRGHEIQWGSAFMNVNRRVLADCSRFDSRS